LPQVAAPSHDPLRPVGGKSKARVRAADHVSASNAQDLLAVSYGDTGPIPSADGGLVLFWSLKNPTYPERVIRTRTVLKVTDDFTMSWMFTI